MVKLSTYELGQKGERIAAAYLRTKGYTIIALNWRQSTLEVDIIAQDQNILVFIEVKYRSDERYGRPAEFITERQMQNLAIAAGHYLEEHKFDGPCRFDVIGIVAKAPPHYSIRHYVDAFFPGW
ncbi:YraN family protein [Membranihabitans marinus]|uniref:YraN family protein n=1 Tax=Membranihabitans marinus TaxID=1227546 RepID=UPI001F0137DC|nr:YraN family protein [Membranihabitans marinus]